MWQFSLYPFSYWEMGMLFCRHCFFCTYAWYQECKVTTKIVQNCVEKYICLLYFCLMYFHFVLLFDSSGTSAAQVWHRSFSLSLFSLSSIIFLLSQNTLQMHIIFSFLGQLNWWPCQSLVHSMSNWLTIGWLDFGPIKIYSMINCDLFCMLVSGTRCLKWAFFLPKNRCLFVNFVFPNVCLPCLKSIGLVYYLL